MIPALSGIIGLRERTIRRIRRIRRRFQLALLFRQTPERLLQLSEKRFRQCFQRAANRSRAYKTLLREAGIVSPASWSVAKIIAQAPVLDKATTFQRFSLSDLVSDDISVASLGGVLTSSGYGGQGFAFGLSTHAQMHAAPDQIDLGLELAFSIDSHASLLVNCLPMGVVFNSRSVCVANVSVREDMALTIIREAMSLYQQIILCIDPLFLKRLLDYADEQGMDWSGIAIHIILGGETFAEDFRSYIAGKFGIMIDSSERFFGSTMGVAELGLNLFFETPETVALRRLQHIRAKYSLLPTFFCYNPLRTFVEILDCDERGVGELVVTVLDPQATVPLIRYRTGDLAYRVRPKDLVDIPDRLHTALKRQPFPVIAMLGRRRDWINARWHVDHFKSILYRNSLIADHLSGAFLVHDTADGISVTYQIRRNSSADSTHLEAVLSEVVMTQAEGSPPPIVRCAPYESFPFGMGLDYERKYAYYRSHPVSSKGTSEQRCESPRVS